MAQIEKLIPHILLWENSVKVKEGETLESAYKRATAKGPIKAKADLGGWTMAGVTLGTYSDWRRRRGFRTTTKEDLARMTYAEWLAILKGMFWDKCQGDKIRSQSVANMFVDWAWHAGGNGIRAAQTCLCLVADGVVGPKTLAALNGSPASVVFNRIKFAREAYYRKLAAQSPTQAANLKGWLNRNNALEFEG